MAMGDFRGRGFEAPLGIGKRNVGEPVPGKYKGENLKAAPTPEPVRFEPPRSLRNRSSVTELQEKMDFYGRQ